VLAWKTNSAPHIVHLARGLAASSRGLALSSRGVAVSSRRLAVSSRGLAVSSRGLTVSSRGLAPSSRGLALSSRGMLVSSPRGLTNSVSAEVASGSFNRKNRQTPDLGRRVNDPAQRCFSWTSGMTKDSSLLLHSIHSLSTGGLLKKTRLYSGFKST
jgi:hypothetical protein